MRVDNGQRTLIVGAGRTGRSLMRELRETPGERVVGFLDDDPRLWRRRLQGVPVLGTADESPACSSGPAGQGARDDSGRAAGTARRVVEACAEAGRRRAGSCGGRSTSIRVSCLVRSAERVTDEERRAAEAGKLPIGDTCISIASSERTRTLAVPVVLIILMILFWEASVQKTPTIFSDELKWAQLSRSIASTGHAAHRGQATSFQSLYLVPDRSVVVASLERRPRTRQSSTPTSSSCRRRRRCRRTCWRGCSSRRRAAMFVAVLAVADARAWRT